MFFPQKAENDMKVKMVVLEGQGEKAFCAGGDIRGECHLFSTARASFGEVLNPLPSPRKESPNKFAHTYIHVQVESEH